MILVDYGIRPVIKFRPNAIIAFSIIKLRICSQYESPIMAKGTVSAACSCKYPTLPRFSALKLFQSPVKNYGLLFVEINPAIIIYKAPELFQLLATFAVVLADQGRGAVALGPGRTAGPPRASLSGGRARSPPGCRRTVTNDE